MLYSQGKTDCSPCDVNYDGSRLDILHNHFQKLIDNNEIYCAMYGMSRKGRLFAHGGVGYKTYKKDPEVPVSPTDVQYIASITKTFTGVAVMKLFEDGVTRLDTPVGEILPQFNAPPFNKITLYQLLTHTSGMHPDGGCFPNEHNHGGYWHFIQTAYEAHKNNKAEDKGEFDWLAAALAFGVRDVPGRQWMYSSFGFVVLGEVISKLTGVNCHDYIVDNICKPLGLNDTGFELTADRAKRYIIQGERAEKYIEGVISGSPVEDEDDKLWNTVPSTGGGMHSSVLDLIRYGNMMLNKGTLDGVRILGRKAVEKMTKISIQIPDYCWDSNGELRSYGIGFDHRNGPQFCFSDSTYMHEGAGACALYIDPEEEMVAAWIVPFGPTDAWCSKAMFNTVNIMWSGIK